MSRVNKERYYCEECKEKFHQHDSTYIIKKTFEIKYKWLELDGILSNIEKEFKKNMHGSMDLIKFCEDIACGKNF
jgi:hypothetical protein